MKNTLYYGDNLDILRKKIKDETVDLCYIDPPFNSKRNYNQIYNRLGKEDRAQAQAFTDTWIWDERAISGYAEILANDRGRFQSQLVELLKGLRAVLGEDSLLAYLVSMALRITEIHRVLKPTGSFYLHCDPTASHYLKILLDAIFLPGGGDIKNEIVWHYRRWTGRAKKFQELHDLIFFYVKSSAYTFNVLYTPYTEGSKERKEQGVLHRFKAGEQPHLVSNGTTDEKGVRENDVWQIPFVAPSARERLGYPTQKPEALLERIIKASSNEGSMVLDAYCGCGTTIVVAQQLKRRWIGMDITYQSISLVLRRLEKAFGTAILDTVKTDGIPRDMESAVALAHKKDDRLRKEFEKWAVLTYTNNRAIINEKKGADAGIDARAYFLTGKKDNAKIIFQVKSGSVNRGDIATLRGDMGREKAALAILITLEEPSSPMLKEAKAAGQYKHETMGRSYDQISIVTIREIVEDNKRLDIPMSLEVLAAARRVSESNQLTLL
ncbi:MAG: restriction endonuclease [Planctomycetales bacterium]|nr:restriction endonuclease [Planctomycetales bacterium]